MLIGEEEMGCRGGECVDVFEGGEGKKDAEEEEEEESLRMCRRSRAVYL